MTRKQLHKRWKREFALNNLPSSQEDETPFTGKIVGKIKYDEKAKTLEIVPLSDPKTLKT